MPRSAFRWLALPLLLVGPAIAQDTPTPPATPAQPAAATPAPAQPTDPATQLAAYQKALENATALLEDLRTQLATSNQRITALEQKLKVAGIDPQSQPAGPGQAATPADPAQAARAARDQADAERRAKVAAFLAEREAQRNARQTQRDAADAAEREAAAKAPKWWYTWQIGYVERDSGQTTFVKVVNGKIVLFTGDKSRIDPRVLIVSGTFENRSSLPYRYTFDVQLIGSGAGGSFTRYQTPVLNPGELHRWELTMNVDNAWGVDSVQIANVRGDGVVDPNEGMTQAEPEPVAEPYGPVYSSYPNPYYDSYAYNYPSYYPYYGGYAFAPIYYVIRIIDKDKDDHDHGHHGGHGDHHDDDHGVNPPKAKIPHDRFLLTDTNRSKAATTKPAQVTVDRRNLVPARQPSLYTPRTARQPAVRPASPTPRPQVIRPAQTVRPQPAVRPMQPARPMPLTPPQPLQPAPQQKSAPKSK